MQLIFYITDIADKADPEAIVDVSNVVEIIGIIDDDCLIQKILLKIIKGWYSTLKKLKIMNSSCPTETNISAFQDLFGLWKITL